VPQAADEEPMIRGHAFPIALGALLALGALTTFMVLRPGPAPSHADVAHQIAADLRCPDCQGLSVADSSSASALEIRRQIDAQLSAGRSPDQVKQSFVDRYGQWILLSPTAFIAWLLPFGVLLAAIGLLAAWIVRARRPGARSVAPASASPISELERARVREEAEALDA
jgi:cytochrome c-type biogenesis protein CcmH